MDVRYFAQALIFIALMCSSAILEAKVWCEFPNGTGYYAESCPDKAKPKAVAAPPEKPAAWVPKIGMTANDVERHISAPNCMDVTPYEWCRRPDKHTTKTAHGESEQWAFGDGHRIYLYFEDGLLTAIQD